MKRLSILTAAVILASCCNVFAAGTEPAQRYSIEQAISDNAQLHTIAFSGLAFLTGDFGAATFIPPGKVCDYFGFQYMRDIDQGQKGHNPAFLNRVVGNALSILNNDQREILKKLAETQAPGLRAIAEKRWPLIKAFYQESASPKPILNHDAVVKHVGEIFAMDGELSIERAKVFGQIARSLTPEQKTKFAALPFGNFGALPALDGEDYKLPRGSDKMVNVAYMTYASEFFSWYKGSVMADTYFCPERHGTYFGGFYMKDMPVMGKKDVDISTSVTGDSGRDFLALLTPEQRRLITGITDKQRGDLQEIVRIRQEISTELRKFMTETPPDLSKVRKLAYRYGELDGDISYQYAMAFAAVNRTLSAGQRAQMTKLRNLDNYTSAPAYIYSAEQKQPVIGDTAKFFNR